MGVEALSREPVYQTEFEYARIIDRSEIKRLKGTIESLRAALEDALAFAPLIEVRRIRQEYRIGDSP